MKPTIFLSALLLAPAYALAAPAAPSAPAMQEGHSADDGHDHGAKANDGSLTDYLWRRSDAAFHDGDYPRAIELHRAIVTVDPTDVESYGVGAWLLWSSDKKAEADAFITQGLKDNPDNWEMWDTAAKQYGLEKRFAPERDAYARAVELAGAGADMMMRRRYAHASEHAGDLKGSAQIWRALAAEFPNDAVTKNNLARVEAMLAAENKGDVKAMGALGLGVLLLMAGGVWKRRVV